MGRLGLIGAGGRAGSGFGTGGAGLGVDSGLAGSGGRSGEAVGSVTGFGSVGFGWVAEGSPLRVLLAVAHVAAASSAGGRYRPQYSRY